MNGVPSATKEANCHFARRAADFHTRRIAFQGVRHGAARIAYRGYAVAADDIIRKIGKTQGGCLKFPQQRHFGFGDDLSRFFATASTCV